jgi:hypothetical protein
MMLAKIGRPTRAPRRGERRMSLGLSVTAGIKRRLDAAANKHGRSQSQEAERRIEQSFAQEDAYSGEEMRDIATLMAATFVFHGRLIARGNSPPSEWLHDRFIYLDCIKAVTETLLFRLQPSVTEDEIVLFVESLKGRVATRFYAERPRS